MYAIIEVGSKQYTVKKDDIIDVEKQGGAEGKDIRIPHVLLLSKEKHIEVGTPFVKGAHVEATLLKQVKGPKIDSFKYRRRKSSDTKTGYRAKLSRLKIKAIEVASS
jgi:large subunit ribosomal protein L21